MNRIADGRCREALAHRAARLFETLERLSQRESWLIDFTDEFWKRVGIVRHSECWLWTGRLTRDGYGRFRVSEDGKRRNFFAHRVAYTRTKGAVPVGFCIDHLCGVRRCVNPHHLEAVTSSENSRRMHRRNRANYPELYRAIGNRYPRWSNS